MKAHYGNISYKTGTIMDLERSMKQKIIREIKAENIKLGKVKKIEVFNYILPYLLYQSSFIYLNTMKSKY